MSNGSKEQELPPLESSSVAPWRRPARFSVEYRDCIDPSCEGTHEWTREQRDGMKKFALRLLDELAQRENHLRESRAQIATLAKRAELLEWADASKGKQILEFSDDINDKEGVIKAYEADIATLSAQVEELTKRTLIARRSFHNLNTCNQYFERCEHPICNPDAPLATLESSTFAAIPGDRVKLERIVELDAELATLTDKLEDARKVADKAESTLTEQAKEHQRIEDDLKIELAALREGFVKTFEVDWSYATSPNLENCMVFNTEEDLRRWVRLQGWRINVKGCKEAITRERILDTDGGEG